MIAYNLNLASQWFDGKIGLNESYFGGIHKGKCGRGAGGKTAVFGLLKRNGKVFVVVVKDAKTDTLMPIIKSKIKPDSIVYTDFYKSYDMLDVSKFNHLRINHSTRFAKKTKLYQRHWEFSESSKTPLT